jgi:hypothetical protein
LPVGDTDNLAMSFGVGLGASYVQEHAGRLGLDVGKSQGGQLGAAQRRGEADQDERGVARTFRGGAVDRRHDPAKLVQSERPCLALWGGTQSAAQASPYLTDGLADDRVVESAAAVDVGDRGA